MRVLIVEDEPFLAEAIRDGLRLEAIAGTAITPDGEAVIVRVVADLPRAVDCR